MFLVTHNPPESVPQGRGTYKFVTDGVESAVAQAKAAAGDKDVLLHGADVAQQCLRAGLLDEMVLHLMHLLLGEGRPMFGRLGINPVQLELMHLREAPRATHMRFRVVR